MNTTDCEKIECRVGKEFNFQGNFDANFDVLTKDKGRSEMSINKVDTLTASEKQNIDLENHNVIEEYPLETSNSCVENNKENVFGSLANINTIATNAHTNFTHIETLKNNTTPPSCTALVLTPAKEQQLSLSSHLNVMTNMDGDDGQVDFDDGLQPLSERWSPLGANYDDAVTPSSELLSPESELELLSSDSQDNKHDFHQHVDEAAEMAHLKSLEEEQEMLTSSLMALTSHFAHVQLRVRQIVEAPANERDQLLKDLEEFAFQGIPDPHTAKTSDTLRSGLSTAHNHNGEDNTGGLTNDQKQCELIDQLKSQLIELEKIAYESGAPVLPQHILLEKQKIIIDELKQKLNFKVDEQKLPQLTAEELKSQVDNAIGEFVGPLKMKEQLVAQLKTQITDLERFIAFLQCDTDESKMKTLTGSEKFCEAYNSYAAKKKKESKKSANIADIDANRTTSSNTQVELNRNSNSGDSLRMRESLHSKAHGLMDKASLLMQMFATTHFGSKQEQFQKNTLKKTHKGNHWGDLRAQLEVDIQEVASLAATLSFDREKLSKLRKAMKKSKTFKDTEEAVMKNGIITTVPPSCSRNLSKLSTPNQQKQLKSYTVSSGSDDEDFDTYDYYDWQKQNNRRMVQCARIRGDTINTLSKELTTAVRKNFAMTLLKLMQHGLRVESIPPVTSSLIVPFMRCLNPSPVFVAEHSYRARDFDASSFMSSSTTFGYEDTEGIDGSSSKWSSESGNGGGGFFSSGSTRPMHAWELILEYYYLKHGDEYNNTPARKLSQSFNLDIVNSQLVTAKQNLLSVIGSIIAMHRPYKRSYNAHFKAFVCAGLNCHQLVEWLNLIFSCTDLIENYYTNTSYVACTGFRDALRSIDTLSKYDFDLPVDLAIRHFRNL
ncbi:RUN domain-containing protein 1 [Cochliomyia hominivorax]